MLPGTETLKRTFLNLTSIPRVRNTLWLLLSLVIAAAQGFGITYLLSRDLGLIGFGSLGVIINSMNLILFAAASVTPQVLKIAAQEKDRDNISLVTAGIVVQLLFSAVIMWVSFGVLILSSGDLALIGPAAVLAISLVLRSLTGALVAAQMGREKMEWQLLESIQLTLSFVFVVGLISLGSGLYAYPAGSLAGVLIIGGVTLWMFRNANAGRKLLPTLAEIKALVIASIALGVVNLGQQMHWSLEAVLAPKLISPIELGVFIAGTRLVPIVRSLATAVNLVSLPIFVRQAAEAQWSAVSREAERCLRYLALAGFGAAIGLFAFSNYIVAILYPEGFEGAGQILRILSFNVLAMFLHWEALSLLFAAEKYRALILGYGTAFALRLILGVLLGTQAGGIGLAVAQLISDWVMVLVLHGIAIKVLDLHYGKTLLKIIACLLATLPTLGLTTMGVPIFAASLAAAVVFGLALVVTRVLTLQDVQSLFNLPGGLWRYNPANRDAGVK